MRQLDLPTDRDQAEREAQLALAQVRYDQAPTLQAKKLAGQIELDEARAELDVARALRNAARDQVAYTRLTAPFDGMVTWVSAENHQTVQARVPVLQLQDNDQLEVHFSVPESLISRLIRIRDPNDLGDYCGEVRFASHPGETFRACHKEFQAVPDPLTRTYPVVFALDPIEAFSVLPGMSVGGTREEQVFIEVDRAKLAATGFGMSQIEALLQGQNLVADAGDVGIGSESVRIQSRSDSGNGLAQLENLLVGQVDGQVVYLRDVADVTYGCAEPPRHLYRFDGQRSLGVGISFRGGVNVLEVGQAIDARLAELDSERPLGIEITSIYNQPAAVTTSVDAFLVGLAQAVGIVVVVLLFTMGLRPGILMSGVLLLTILGTFIVMGIAGIELHRISLGALIIALGMLVDNAIVITEGILIGLKRGLSRVEAATRIVRHTRWPLLGATLIAITAFAPIGLSPDVSGEFAGSLLWVPLISLLLSWALAITLTPFFCVLMFREPPRAENGAPVDPYGGIAYRL
jgi:hypothetical protein